MTRSLQHILLAMMMTFALISQPFAANATAFNLDNYQDQSGAITIHLHGTVVDPYFSLKALLTAHASGLDIQDAGTRWIKWLLPLQQTNGLFNRYCKQADGGWLNCKEADADDALLAMWIEFVYIMSPDNGISIELRASVKKAWQQLDQLLDRKNGIYHISKDKPVGLFMDNVEIESAFRTIAKEQRRLNDFAGAELTLRKARSLHANIERVFRPIKSEPYKVSTQNIPDAKDQLYPHALAQIYPLLHLTAEDARGAKGESKGGSKKALELWLAFYGAEWLSFTKDHYPWGLVAITARQLGDCETAQNWLSRSAHLRHSNRWNVLEEAALQSIEQQKQPNNLSCK